MEFFTDRRPRIGLSEFSKLSGYNKATTLRFLTALDSKGFVEQDPATRLYNLGPAVLRFAQLREASFPLAEAVQTVLRDLNAATGETAHASVLSGEVLVNTGSVESRKANRVFVELGEALPFHATASGLVFLAFAAQDFMDAALGKTLERHTEETVTDRARIETWVKEIRQRGVAKVTGAYEAGVVGIAAPVFGPGGSVNGAVAVATPTIRADDAHLQMIEREVRVAARRLTALRGGALPDAFPAPAADLPPAHDNLHDTDMKRRSQ